MSENFQKSFLQALSYWKFKEQRTNSLDLDEEAHFEPPHLELRCLQIQLFLFFVIISVNMESVIIRDGFRKHANI